MGGVFAGRRRRNALRSPLILAPLLAAAGLTGSLRAQVAAPPAEISIDASTALHKVSPTLFGLMTEEINYSYDGGIYAELVRNRTFHDARRASLAHWRLAQDGNARASMALDEASGPSAALPVSLKLTVTAADAGDSAGIENDGFWGIALHPGTTYQGSFYAKADSAGMGDVTVSLVNDNTGKIEARATVAGIGADWRQYRFVLKTESLAAGALNHLVLSVNRPGTVWFDLISLFPPTYRNRPNGNRIDLMQMLAAMKPAFLRLPGGNYLEGNTIAERFNWKETIGPLVDRPTHTSPWGYRSSDGMGLLEFLNWCEDLHMQPVLAVYAGYSLQGEHVAPGPDLAPYVQDALDEIEYVTGGADTRWGAERAKDGHPAPFPLTYVEIGNEDEFDRSHSYDGRFAQFYDAIKKKYPQLQLIATTPVASRKPDVIDDHFYRRAEQFFEDVHHYDGTDRGGPKIFVGEWATREGAPTPNFGAALGDAAWMTGLERNSDIVVMASYAPLFTNVNPGGLQWESDLIGYNAASSYGSPSYYAQVMFSNHHGDEVVASQSSGGGPRFFYSATRDSARRLSYLTLVNADSIPQPLRIQLSGVSAVSGTGRLIALHAESREETNSIDRPTQIVPVESAISGVSADFRRTMPAFSIQILELRER